jgi:hypothetical protein
MTQTIKERLKLLKKRNPELNEYADNYAQHIYVRNKGFNEGVDACLPLLEEVRKETWEEAIKLSEEIERVEPDGGTRQWIAFKRFRNTLRDYLSTLDKTPPDKV